MNIKEPLQPEQLVHESETQRQYIRVDMQARARIKNEDYIVHNISAGGISIQDDKNPYRAGQVFDFCLIVPFQSFALDIPLKVEVEHYNKNSGLLGCRFIDLTKEKISIITHIVRGYIAGDLVTAGEILNVLSRNNFSKARPRSASHRSFTFGLRQIIPLLLIALLGLSAVYFLTGNIYRSLYTIQSARGVVETDVQDIKNPQTGIFQSALKKDLKIINSGQKIGRVIPSLLDGNGPTDTLIELKSPCKCYIIFAAAPEDYIEAGSSIVTLVPVDATPWVSVVVDPGQAQKIHIGDRADLKIAGTDFVLTGKVVKYEASLQDLKNISANGGASEGVTTLLIQPDRKLPIDLRGRPVSVTFRL